MIRSTEQYNSACEELRILSQKDRILKLNEAERIRFDALAHDVSRYEEDPLIFHSPQYRSPLNFEDETGHEHSAR